MNQMKFMFRLSLFALLLFGVAGTVLAQEVNFPFPLGEKQKAYTSAFIGPVMRTMFNGDRTGVMILGLAINPMFPGFKEEFGITEEQIQTIKGSFAKLKDMEGMEGIGEVFKNLTQKIDENIEYEPTAEDEAVIETAFQAIIESMNGICAETFSAEQMQKMDGMMFQLMGGLESPFLSEKSWTVLDLTEEQKSKLAEIDKEVKPGRDKILDEVGQYMKKMLKSGKMNLKELKEFDEKFKEFAENLKKKRSEVLTEDQLAKAVGLTAKPPKFLASSPLMKMIPDWVPGMNSWKPGDGVSEEQKSERRKRKSFPKSE